METKTHLGGAFPRLLRIPRLVAKTFCKGTGWTLCLWACSNELGKVLLSDLEQVVGLEVGVVYNIFANKLAEASVFFGGPVGHVVSEKNVTLSSQYQV